MWKLVILLVYIFWVFQNKNSEFLKKEEKKKILRLGYAVLNVWLKVTNFNKAKSTKQLWLLTKNNKISTLKPLTYQNALHIVSKQFYSLWRKYWYDVTNMMSYRFSLIRFQKKLASFGLQQHYSRNSFFFFFFPFPLDICIYLPKTRKKIKGT